jgi:hypothetical protein
MFYVEGPVFSSLCGYAAQNLPGFLGPIQEFLLTTDMTDVLITLVPFLGVIALKLLRQLAWSLIHILY